MENSDRIIKEQAACGHEVAVTINNLNDLVAASSFKIADIKKAISTASCPACVLLEATRNP